MQVVMGIKVAAEGVESEKQKRVLAEAGCDLVQSYLFSMPVDAASFSRLSGSRF